MNDLDWRIADLVSQKIQLDDKKQKYETERFEYEYISQNADVESVVFKLLNGYDYVCLGGNKNLFNNNIMKDMRGDALKSTWEQYKSYIDTYRNQQKTNAWRECDDWIRGNYP
jgi:hypothetical protein